MGVPLISRMRSPTWMEFFMSGLMQSGSTLQGRQAAGVTPRAPTPSWVGMCRDTAHEPPPANGDRLSPPLQVTLEMETCCHGTYESLL